MRECTRCKETKPFSAFTPDRRSKDGIRTRCKDCRREVVRERTKRWRAANPERHRQNQRESAWRAYWRRYGLTREDYNRMLAEQGGVCAICGDPPERHPLHVDHHHETDTIRDLICVRCNLGLGYFKEDPERLIAAIAYLARHERLKEPQM